MNHLGVDSSAAGRLATMVAETQPEQVDADGPEFLEVAFVMVAVLESVEVEGLREDGRDPVAGDVRGERARVHPHLGVRGAQVGRVAISESVLRGALGVRETQSIVVQEYGPGVHGHSPLIRDLAQLAERISRANELADAWPQVLVTGHVRREKDGATL